MVSPDLPTLLDDIVYGPQPSPDCVPRIGDETGATTILPTPKPVAPLNPEELNPGLAPGIDEFAPDADSDPSRSFHSEMSNR